MNNQFLSFSSGCVINLDDLGQFPDYYEVIEKLRAGLKNKEIDAQTLNTFTEADLDDIQHVP